MYRLIPSPPLFQRQPACELNLYPLLLTPTDAKMYRYCMKVIAYECLGGALGEG